jgi:hypothetical protein
MSEISRRTVLSGATALTAACLGAGVSDTAQGAAPATGKQAPGFYRYKIGDFEVTVVTDGANTLPLPESFVVNAKKEEVSAALAAAYLDKDKLTIPYTPIVVNTGEKLVLIDTGQGERPSSARRARPGSSSVTSPPAAWTAAPSIWW